LGSPNFNVTLLLIGACYSAPAARGCLPRMGPTPSATG
jgi:hypothetical protein